MPEGHSSLRRQLHTASPSLTGMSMWLSKQEDLREETERPWHHSREEQESVHAG